MNYIGVIREIRRSSGHLSVEWKIGNFSSLLDKKNDWYFSPDFVFADAKWWLRMDLNRVTPNAPSGCILLSLVRIDRGPSVNIHYNLGIEGAAGLKMIKKGEFPCSDWVFAGFEFLTGQALRDNQSLLVPNDELTVSCSLMTIVPSPSRDASSPTDGIVSETYVTEENKSAEKLEYLDASSQTDGIVSEAEVSEENKSAENLADDEAEEERNEINDDDVDNEESTIKSEILLSQVKKTKKISLPIRHKSVIRSLKAILDGGKRADFTLKSGNRDWPVHRAILEGRSRHFATLFRGEWAEMDEVRIDDVTEGALDCVLHFLYAGDVGGVSIENVCGIYAASREFLLEDLKLACVKYMKENMCPEMVCGALAIAETHGEGDLKERALECFFRESDRTVVTDGWKRLKEKHPAIIGQLFEEFIKRERENRRKD